MFDEAKLPATIDMKTFKEIRVDFLLRAYMKVSARYEEKVIALEGLKEDLNGVNKDSGDAKMLLSDIETKRKEVENEIRILNRVVARLRLLDPSRASLVLSADDLYSPKEKEAKA